MDLPGRCLREAISNLVKDLLVANGLLPSELSKKVIETLVSRESMPTVGGGTKSAAEARRQCGVAGQQRPARLKARAISHETGDDEAPARSGIRPFVRRPSSEKAPLPRLSIEGLTLEAGHGRDASVEAHRRDVDAAKHAKEVDQQASIRPPSSKRAHLDLSPDSGEEAFELLVAHVDYVSKPLMAFVRLAAPIQTGCEKGTPVRFLYVLLAPAHAPSGARAHCVQMATAFASIMLDEDFAAAVRACHSTATFHTLLARELDCVTIVPSSHVPHHSTRPPTNRSADTSAPSPATSAGGGGSLSVDARVRSSIAELSTWQRARLRALFVVHECQVYSLPLLLGIALALTWANTDYDSYDFLINSWEPLPDFILLGHHLTIKFLVNGEALEPHPSSHRPQTLYPNPHSSPPLDIFMVFFFGLAAKEVTEAGLPGGSLNPPRKALSPLVGTLAGVLGPIAVFLLILSLQYYVLGAFEGYAHGSGARTRHLCYPLFPSKACFLRFKGTSRSRPTRRGSGSPPTRWGPTRPTPPATAAAGRSGAAVAAGASRR